MFVAPILADKLLRLLLPYDKAEIAIGDLLEEASSPRALIPFARM